MVGVRCITSCRARRFNPFLHTPAGCFGEAVGRKRSPVPLDRGSGWLYDTYIVVRFGPWEWHPLLRSDIPYVHRGGCFELR
jgi:hypothetical protein